MDRIFARIGLEDFLENNPKVSLRPSTDDNIFIRGKFNINATYRNGPPIHDEYNLEVQIPPDFPQRLPLVKELDNRINMDSTRGHLLGEEFLCLGSPQRMFKIIGRNPTISYFFNKCVIPYLYAISFHEMYGGAMIFGELNHGAKGLFEDYLELYDEMHLTRAMYLVNKKKRVANKIQCPCGCNKRLGKCKLHNKINALRKLKYL